MHYGFKFESRPPVFVREREDCYCPSCYSRMWPSVPPSDYARNLLAIVPIKTLAAARGLKCCICKQTLT